MHSQIRGIEAVDTRMWEWRERLSEEIRERLSEMERAYQTIASSVRVSKATNEDEHKKVQRRLNKLEGLIDERIAQGDEMSQTLMNFHARVELVEDIHNTILTKSAMNGSPTKASIDTGESIALFNALEAQLGSSVQKVEDLRQESQEIRMQMAMLEERYNFLRTVHEAKEDMCRCFADRLERENWDGRFKELQNRVNEINKDKIQHAEKLEIHQKIFEGHEQAQEDL